MRNLVVALLAAAVGAGCTDRDGGVADRTELRRVEPLVSIAAQPTLPALRDDRFDEPVEIGPGTPWRIDLAVEPPTAYMVRIEYEGARPTLRGGPLDQGEDKPLRVVAGSAEGVVEATFRPVAADAFLGARVTKGVCRLKRFLVRPWAIGVGVAVDEGRVADARPVWLDVLQDYRQGFLLDGDGPALELEQAVPENATRLALAVALDPTQPAEAPAAQGWTLSVGWRESARTQVGAAGSDDGADDPVRELGTFAVEATRAQWQELRLPVDELAGKAGRWVFSVERRDATGKGTDAGPGSGSRSDSGARSSSGSRSDSGSDSDSDSVPDTDADTATDAAADGASTAASGSSPRSPSETAAPSSRLAITVPELLCERGERRPNLVLVSLDTTRPDHLGPYGYDKPTTPNLDRLAERSVVFEEALTVAPYTLPSHTTIFSGQYPPTHGVVHPAHTIDTEQTPLLADLLRKRGYATRAFTGGGYLSAEFGFSHGFGAYSDHDPVFDLDHPGFSVLRGTRAGRLLIEALQAQGWDAALAWIEDHHELPFFLFLQTFAIHDYRPTGESRDLFAPDASDETVRPLRSLERQAELPYTDHERELLVHRYDAAIHQVDGLLGQLFETLARLEIEDDTVVVITADHGETFGEHVIHGTPLVGHGWGLWDALLAVPLIVHVPGVPPRRVADRVSLVDLAPTVLDVLGVATPNAVQGRSLRPLFDGDPRDVRPSPALAEVSSHVSQQSALYIGAAKVVTGNPNAKVSVPIAEEVQLFDLRADPDEMVNRRDEDPEAARRMADELALLLEMLEADRTSTPGEANLSPETIEALKALGYLDG